MKKGGYEPSFSILIEKVSVITDRRKEKNHDVFDTNERNCVTIVKIK